VAASASIARTAGYLALTIIRSWTTVTASKITSPTAKVTGTFLM
jgi:hypothetical protein